MPGSSSFTHSRTVMDASVAPSSIAHLAQDENRSSRLYSLSARFMAVRDDYYDALQALLAW